MNSKLNRPSAFLAAVLAAAAWLPPAAGFAREDAAPPAIPAPQTPPGGAAAERVLSLDDCLAAALRANLDLKIQRVAREETLQDAGIARAAWDPSLELSAQRNHEKSRLRDAGDGASSFATSDTDTLRAGISGSTPWTGLSYELSARETAADSSASPFDAHGAGVGIAVTQPLLRGFKTDETRYRIAAADVQSEEALAALEQTAQDLLHDVETAWYRFVSARAGIAVQEDAVRLAESLLEDNRRKVRIGAMAPLDELQAESQAASARADLAAARQTAREAEVALKTLVFADARAWTSVRIVPDTELPEPPDVALDVPAAMDAALAQRPDLRQARFALQRQGLLVDLRRNQRLPSLDLVASAGLQATDETSAGDAWSTVSDADEPYWTAGVAFSIPLGNRAARLQWEQSRTEQERLSLQLHRLEENALAEIDVAAAAVDSARERLAAAREACRFARQSLDAEQHKLAAGKSTSFVVLQLQKDLTSARRALVSALADCHQSLADFAHATGGTFGRLAIEWSPDAP